MAWKNVTDSAASAATYLFGTTPANVESDPIVRNILLIGASQNGKSSLANFLVNNRALSDDVKDLHFPIGDGTKSLTTKVTCCQTQWMHHYLPPEFTNMPDILNNSSNAKKYEKRKICTFKIIDAPGIGDSDEDTEQKSMECLYSFLEHLKSRNEKLSMALLVIKYPPFLDESLKQKILYYKKMFPEVMTSSIFLVITNVQGNPKWVAQQKRGGRPDPKIVIERIRNELKNWLQHDYYMPVENIDSLCESKDEEEHNAKMVRARIFATCLESKGVDLKIVRLPKTKKMLKEDSEKIENLKGVKEGLIKGVQLLEQALGNEAELLNTTKTELNGKLNSIRIVEEQLNDYDNTDLHPFQNASFSDTWHLLRWTKREFDITTPYPIELVEISEEEFAKNKTPIPSDDIGVRCVIGYPYYTTKKKQHIAGVLYSPFSRELNCHMTLFTQKRIFYSDKIKLLKFEIETLSKDVKSLTLKYNELKDTQTLNELKNLQEKISKIDDDIKNYSCNYIILDALQISFGEKFDEKWVNIAKAEIDDETKAQMSVSTDASKTL